jgi:hypothetical protein
MRDFVSHFRVFFEQFCAKRSAKPLACNLHYCFCDSRELLIQINRESEYLSPATHIA